MCFNIVGQRIVGKIESYRKWIHISHTLKVYKHKVLTCEVTNAIKESEPPNFAATCYKTAQEEEFLQVIGVIKQLQEQPSANLSLFET